MLIWWCGLQLVFRRLVSRVTDKQIQIKPIVFFLTFVGSGQSSEQACLITMIAVLLYVFLVLAQRGYFKKPCFVNYLKYLLYWKQPEYAKFLMWVATNRVFWTSWWCISQGDDLKLWCDFLVFQVSAVPAPPGAAAVWKFPQGVDECSVCQVYWWSAVVSLAALPA